MRLAMRWIQQQTGLKQAWQQDEATNKSEKLCDSRAVHAIDLVGARLGIQSRKQAFFHESKLSNRLKCGMYDRKQCALSYANPVPDFRLKKIDAYQELVRH